jgi:hypothetical protein
MIDVVLAFFVAYLFAVLVVVLDERYDGLATRIAGKVLHVFCFPLEWIAGKAHRKARKQLTHPPHKS